MPQHTITVSATIADPFPPALSDDEGHSAHNSNNDKNFTTNVGPGDVVIWQAGGDITSLEEISYSAGTDLFVQPPRKQNDGTWRGVIGPNTTTDNNTIEEYDISYIVNNGMFYTQDPKLQFKSGIGS